MRIVCATLVVVLGIGSPALAAPISGISLACGKAYEAMTACRRKFAASDAPADMKQLFDQQYAKQMADAVAMWRSMRGVAGVEQSCKELAANPTCEDRPE